MYQVSSYLGVRTQTELKHIMKCKRLLGNQHSLMVTYQSFRDVHTLKNAHIWIHNMNSSTSAIHIKKREQSILTLRNNNRVGIKQSLPYINTAHRQ